MKGKQRAFLAAYRQTSSLTAAAAAAKVQRGMHYRWMLNPAYAAAFEETREEAAGVLEDEAVRRAVVGVEDAVLYQGAPCFFYHDIVDPETGEVTGRERGKQIVEIKYSDMLLTLLLKGAKPAKYRENVRAELSGPGGAPIPIDQNLAKLTDDELAAFVRIAEILSAPKDAGSGAGT